jgi:multiple sugar transport system substrate-binding protein
MRRNLTMKTKLFLLTAVIVAASLILAACGTTATTAPTTAPAATDTAAPAAATNTPAPAAATAVPPTPTLTPFPVAACQAGKTCVRWFVGLGTGTSANQIPPQQAVVDAYNASQSTVQLILEVVPNASSTDVLSTEIASGNGPDIVGPVGFSGSNAFHGQWLDLKSYIAKTDTSDFNPALLNMFISGEGDLGLPFAVYPSALIYNKTIFDAAGYSYPPSKYGDKYKMPDGTMVDWNWDTVAKVAQALTTDKNGNNSTSASFDKTNIVNYGFTWGFENSTNYVGAFWQSGSLVAADGKTAQIPDAWKAAWKWTYDGIWGAQPYIPNGNYESSLNNGGNAFDGGHVAMIDAPIWYTCCLSHVTSDGTTSGKPVWDAGIMPDYNGKVGGRIDADTFRILKGTKHPQEAYDAMVYLETQGVQQLIVGSKDNPSAYGAFPARKSAQAAWLTAKQAQFPGVQNWQTFIDGLSYPDVPSAEAYMPNFNKSFADTRTFYSLILNGQNNGPFDLNAAVTSFLATMQSDFNAQP